MSNFPTIVALSTPPGISGVAVIRLSGDKSFAITECVFTGKKISEQASHTLHFGKIKDREEIIDEVLVSIFKSPHSYTGEDSIEIACHGSVYIVQRIIEVIINHGATLAKPGEFTQRAFLNGKLDLSQAEAVADLIASENESQHKMAIHQMRGAYSEKIKGLRQELIDFAALMELELDFSGEDVEFADRKKFLQTVDNTLQTINKLIASFQLGNVIKKGVPVAIIGKPNVGKSTLLNALLNEDKAIVSEIAGTTRDYIEDTLQIKGILYRFIDTAGIRETTDVLENKGIERSYEKMKEADIVLYLADIRDKVEWIVADLKEFVFRPEQKVIILLNKSDQLNSFCDAYDVEEAVSTLTRKPCLEIAAGQKRNIDKLMDLLHEMVSKQEKQYDFVISNARHVAAFQEAVKHLTIVKNCLEENTSSEFVAIDMRAALHALASITGQITSEDILSSVFSRFCIGK